MAASACSMRIVPWRVCKHVMYRDGGMSEALLGLAGDTCLAVLVSWATLQLRMKQVVVLCLQVACAGRVWHRRCLICFVSVHIVQLSHWSRSAIAAVCLPVCW